jgi:hypothetical protein
MKLIWIVLLLAITSCSKQKPEDDLRSDAPKKYNGVNYLEGKWYLGDLTNFCYPGIQYFPGNYGNYVEFKNNDTAYFTEVGTTFTATGPYTILDSKSFRLNYNTYFVDSVNSKGIFVHMDYEGRLKTKWEFLRSYRLAGLSEVKE